MNQGQVNMKLLQSSSILVVGACATSALGQHGGIAFPDQGGIANGTAQSGQAAMALDASTAWLNNAGLTRIEGTQLITALMPFELNLEFNPGAGTTVAGNDGGNAGDWIPGGSFYLSHQLDDVTTFGSLAHARTLHSSPSEALLVECHEVAGPRFLWSSCRVCTALQDCACRRTSGYGRYTAAWKVRRWGRVVVKCKVSICHQPGF